MLLAGRQTALLLLLRLLRHFSSVYESVTEDQRSPQNARTVAWSLGHTRIVWPIVHSVQFCSDSLDQTLNSAGHGYLARDALVRIGLPALGG